ncbi:hypothetical protein KK083_07040 [Fulvivirgaceae bacterium PWU4]|uniref:Uncharacterized protein n=1 Tax=Chryseosolibacter histidini TaxID=2782349 RepID=A0AAP2GI11_9BACT|nr:hypothetical protein [Chryseosolibacter histidini]MBT1696621.1 hypothetical protein [Chryseosolibacter histidini]
MEPYNLNNDPKAGSISLPMAIRPAYSANGSAKSSFANYPAAVLIPYGSVFFSVERYKATA